MSVKDFRRFLPNILCHIFTSCAKLGVNDQQFWLDLDIIVTNRIKTFHLKNLATLSHGLLVRDQNGVKTGEELTALLMTSFIIACEKLKPYTDISSENLKYIKICNKTVSKLTEGCIRADIESNAEVPFEVRYE